MYWYFTEQASRALDIYLKWLDLWQPRTATASSSAADVAAAPAVEAEQPSTAPRPVAYRTPPKPVRAFAAPRPMSRPR